MDTKIRQINSLRRLRAKFKDERIVLATGCFDILHIGHLKFLMKSSKQGDVLVVGINSDKSIKLIKGPSRPIINQNERAQLLAAFACVNHVFIFDGIDAHEAILELRPDVFVMGEGSVDAYPEEVHATQQVGAKLYIMKRFKATSTSSIIATAKRD